MGPTGNKEKRRYYAPARQAAAERTREGVLIAAKRTFEERGWQGATVPLIARRAGVSHQTVEAVFGTKAALLQAVVNYSIRGDTSAVRMPQRQVVAEMEAAPTAASMLDLHALQVRSISERSAAIAWTVEHAASNDGRVAQLWRTMTENRRYGVSWATRTLLGKPDADRSLDTEWVETVFWLALDWGTYRTLTQEYEMSPAAFEHWLRGYYGRTLRA
jgi:AcrR family transcriptional regulator